jgi:hypothetical protein
VAASFVPKINRGVVQTLFDLVADLARFPR